MLCSATKGTEMECAANSDETPDLPACLVMMFEGLDATNGSILARAGRDVDSVLLLQSPGTCLE